MSSSSLYWATETEAFSPFISNRRAGTHASSLSLMNTSWPKKQRSGIEHGELQNDMHGFEALRVCEIQPSTFKE